MLKSKRLRGAEEMQILLQNVKCVTILEILSTVQTRLQNIIKVNNFKLLQHLNVEILKLLSSCQAINLKGEGAKEMEKLYLMRLI